MTEEEENPNDKNKVDFDALMRLFIYILNKYSNVFSLQIDLPSKPISLLGWMIWPRNGRNTNGIFSDDDPLTNGANVHSVKRK